MWAVPKTVNAAARADREERQREAAELRVRRAADLGLSWPKKPRGVGRPSRHFPVAGAAPQGRRQTTCLRD